MKEKPLNNNVLRGSLVDKVIEPLARRSQISNLDFLRDIMSLLIIWNK